MTQPPSRRGDEPEHRESDLLTALRRRTRLALETGALVPIGTERHVVVDRGVPFVVNVLGVAAGGKRSKGPGGGQRPDPFLPYDENLFVADLTPTHVALLNKFTVLEHHLLIVTRRYEEQEALLTEVDFAALGRCLEQIDGLAFYNSGPVAGASQSHRHLQLVPRPSAGGVDPFPLFSRLEAIDPSAPGGETLLPFRHRAIRVEPEVIGRRPAEMVRLYRQAVTELGLLATSRDARPAPYNLLATRRRLLLVPRSRERWGDVSVNALGFAGSLLVRSQRVLDEVRRVGPLDVLRAVAT